ARRTVAFEAASFNPLTRTVKPALGTLPDKASYSPTIAPRWLNKVSNSAKLLGSIDANVKAFACPRDDRRCVHARARASASLAIPSHTADQKRWLSGTIVLEAMSAKGVESTRSGETLAVILN